MANIIDKVTIDGTDVPVVDAESVHFTEQELEEPQKATARQNIGAIPMYNGVYVCFYWQNNAANDLIDGATSGAAVAVVTDQAISGLTAPLLVSYGNIDRGHVSFFGFDATGKIFRSTINLMHNTIDDPTIIENETALVVNITSTTTDGKTTYSADHTYAEIKAAYESRRYVYAVYEKSICMLSYISKSAIHFEMSEITTAIPYRIVGGILHNIVWINITNDGLVTVAAQNGTYEVPQQFIVRISKSEDGIYSASMSIIDIDDTINRFANAANADGIANISVCFGSDLYRLTTIDEEKGSFIFVCEGEITKIFTGTIGDDADIWTYRELIVPNPVAKTDAMTQAVGVDEDGKLYTEPAEGGSDLSLGITGAQVGQIAKITAVDASGKPTAWEPVDLPTGGGGEAIDIAWKHIRDVELAPDIIEAIVSTTDAGDAFSYDEIIMEFIPNLEGYFYVRASQNASYSKSVQVWVTNSKYSQIHLGLLNKKIAITSAFRTDGSLGFSNNYGGNGDIDKISMLVFGASAAVGAAFTVKIWGR